MTTKRQRMGFTQGQRPLAHVLVITWTDRDGVQRAHETARASEASSLTSRLRAEGLEPFTGWRAPVRHHSDRPAVAEALRRMAGTSNDE